MTLKEELEILRGEPIQVFDGDPMEIPCIETSDAEKLCKRPVVSVCMITYNHESYIRQAIEGVMMQKTDFEFELVIGEDCSQDKTREICFEYQKKYPEKIRVLWWRENVSKAGLGGNGQRVRARCRGEFIAFCEGDDYWIDPLKLQKQVDVMRKHPCVGICFCGANMYWQSDMRFEPWNPGGFEPGLIHGRKFLIYHMFGADPARDPGGETFVMTATILIRKSYLDAALSKFKDVFSWRLYLGDKTLLYSISSLSDVFFLADKVAVYRRACSGIMTAQSDKVFRDSSLLRIYFSIVELGLRPRELPRYVLKQFVLGSAGYFRSRYTQFKYLIGFLLGLPKTRFRALIFRIDFLYYWTTLHVIIVERALLGGL